MRKYGGEVSLRYMKSFEHDQLIYEEVKDTGREDERLAEMKNAGVMPYMNYMH